MTRIDVAVLGATGAVGQRFVSLLDDHPRFRVAEVVASKRSAGKRYGDAAHWILDDPMPEDVANLEVQLASEHLESPVCFSAVPGGKAGPIETDLAKRGHKVFSNARDHRMDEDVPLLIPEVNPDHMDLVDEQPHDGFIVTNPNCSSIVLTMTLKPLHDAFTLQRVHVTTWQAVSGAGYPGVASLDILGNVVPYIGGEEDKIETEPQRLLGTLDGGQVAHADLTLSATCTRVPVQEGHGMSVAIETEANPSPEEAAEVLGGFRGEPQELNLPTAPSVPVHVMDQADRPQPRRDWGIERGMAASAGRFRRDPILDLKYVATGSNTIRGAAGGSILNAELLDARRGL